MPHPIFPPSCILLSSTHTLPQVKRHQRNPSFVRPLSAAVSGPSWSCHIGLRAHPVGCPGPALGSAVEGHSLWAQGSQDPPLSATANITCQCEWAASAEVCGQTLLPGCPQRVVGDNAFESADRVQLGDGVGLCRSTDGLSRARRKAEEVRADPSCLTVGASCPALGLTSQAPPGLGPSGSG